MASRRSKSSPAFNEQVVKSFLDQQAVKTVSQVARDNGVGPETLRSWVVAYRAANPQQE